MVLIANDEIKNKITECSLTMEQYRACINDIDEKIKGNNDLDWNDIRLKYDLPYTTDTIRKASSTIFGGVFRSLFTEDDYKNIWNDTYENDNSAIDVQLQELRKEKQKLSDERAALNRRLREEAREEEDLKNLKELIVKSGEKYLPVSNNKYIESDNDLIVCLSDFHIGLDVENSFGEYNSTVAEKRLIDYLEQILAIREIYDSENVYLILLGDIINGEIHYTTQLENRENMVEQIQKSAELISAFVYELSKHFKTVYVNGISGNHSRTNKKDYVLRNNRLDSLVIWYMQAKLSNLNNLYFGIDDNIDSTIGKFKVRGNTYLMVHGDWDDFSPNGVSKLVFMTGIKPAAIFYGHLHKCSYDDISDIKVIRSGTFIGAVDDYCISKRIYGKPSQMVCVADCRGIKVLCPVGLNN